MRIITGMVLLSLVLVFSGCATVGPQVSRRDLQSEIRKLKSEKEVLSAEKDAYKTEAENLADNMGQVGSQLAKLQNLLSQERQKTAALQSKIDALSSELESLESIAVYDERPEIAPQDFTKKVQLALYAAGFDPGKIDGKMGPMTVQAIKDFQEANGLKVDGVVGSETWDALQKYLEMK